MGEFSFDTSGSVRVPLGHVAGWEVRDWISLSPFVQGYVEALFRYLHEDAGLRAGRYAPLAFRHLDPSALALILRDCEAVRAFEAPSLGTERGAKFWAERQAGLYHTWLPLQPYLSDEGKVCLRESA